MAHILSDILLLYLLVSLHVNVIAQEKEPNIIPPGSSLYAGKQPSSWASSSGNFEFGFYRQDDGYAVGIWIVGRPDNTVVWTANRDAPPVSSNATLEFTTQGALLVRTEDRMENIIANLSNSKSVFPYLPFPPFVRGIRPPISFPFPPFVRGIQPKPIPITIDSASMLDTGNFVLYKNRSVVWESFDFPTDTILGGQTLSSGWRRPSELISSVSSSNHSTGKYLLKIDSGGNLAAYLFDSAHQRAYDRSGRLDDLYWSTETWGRFLPQLNLNKKGALSLYKFNEEKVLANGSLTGNETMHIYRATLDPNGIFRLYLHRLESNTTSSGSSTEYWRSLNDECDVMGYCGLNSYCSSRGNHVECYCYPGFTFLNENAKFLGCSQNFTVDGCDTRKDVFIHYNITTFENMTWGGGEPYSLMHLEQEDCKKACEKDCYCGGVLYSSEEGECRMYSLPLQFGRRSRNITTTAFIKWIMGTSPIVINEGNQRLVSTMGSILGSFAGLSFVIAICSFLLYRNRVKSYAKLFENESSGFEQFTLRSFTFNELDEATHGFKDEIGKGSFGAVYKGILPGDGKIIAVKRLEIEGERDWFRTEMTAIGRTNHRNLVRLLGFCVEGSRKHLVYEYSGNGSLANFLFKVNKRPVWKERARIALDVAKGILYLHEECEVCIIHCNIKPRNILLDDSMTAKISDFGLAKLNQTSSTTTYSAPEWQSNSSVSVKVDVFSFGVVLLEIICCRNNIEVQVGSADEILLSTWAYSCFVGGELNKLVEGEEEEEVDMKMLERFVKVGLWCIQDDPTLRPLMKNVILMLEGTMNVPIPP